MGLRELLIDAWSWLNYKETLAPESARRIFPELAGQWVPDEDLRRLATYKTLVAYDQNQAGQLAAAGGDEDGTDRRELGDPARIIDAAVGYLLGAEQHIVVSGAEHAEDEEPSPDAAAAAAMQERLRKWAKREQFPLRMQQAERCAVRSGDAVYVLSWAPDKGRVLLRTYDPGWYFPEWEEGEQDIAEYPTRVHFAWGLPADPEKGLKERVRRITYELGWIGPASRSGYDAEDRPVRELVVGDDGAPLLTAGDTLTENGRITRVYPWAPSRPSSNTCYLTDAEWILDDLRGGYDVYTLPASKARYRTRADGEVLDRLDLQVDFQPVVHIPNSIPDVGEHWGTSILARVMQGLDELAATDTDSASASATTGSPVIALAGARLPVDRATGQPLPVKVKAGSVWELNESGRMDTLDTSPQLAELRSRIDHLQNRIAATSRLTAAGLGLLDPTEVPSGYALALALSPLDSLVGAMRLARADKYALLLRMVQRLHQAGQAWPAGETLPAELVWGPHTPTDRAAVLADVVSGVSSGVLSLETGVRMLQDAGYPIQSAAEEVVRIQRRAFEAAARLADATGDNAAVREYLGLPKADPGVPPVPLLPKPADQ
ncbi:hypothetical protein ACFC0K_15735 [Streptomyces hydrogenans]|uniref:hypothetical protein n=1 Tax=Streptomyces hydrogenans TaxID=1873719 RepID=UPI0035DF38E4